MNPAGEEDRVSVQLDATGGAPPLRFDIRRGPRVADAPVVAVIVLVTRDVTPLVRCLRSVRKSTPIEVQHEVIVVANGTDPARLHTIREREDVTLIHSPVNLGFASGCNLASRMARGARLVFLNDDVVVTPGWLESLGRAMDEDERTAVVGSRVLMADGRLQEAGCVLWSDGSTSGVGRGDDPGGVAYQRRRPVDYVSFCSAMVRRTAWDAAGGFDERYFPAYYEDVDLCLSLQARGWTVVYEPSSVVQHEEGGSASRDFRDFISHRNQRLFVAKWSSTLSLYQSPPADSRRTDAAEQALRQSANRQSAAGVPSVIDQVPLTDLSAPLGDHEEPMLIAASLYADSVVKSEYIQLLEDRATNRGVIDVVRSRLRRLVLARRKN